MLLLLPHRDRSLAQNLPIVTILIALGWILLMVTYHAKDTALEKEAITYYQDSGLGAIELPRYQAFLAQRVDSESAERLHKLRAAPADSPAALDLMQGDARFLKELHAGVVVPSTDPAYASWQSGRRHFDQLVQATGSAQLALSRDNVTQAWPLLSYTFLHSRWWELIGNLIVFALVGAFAEAELGRVRFAACYFLGGAIAGSVQIAFSESSVMGASGAIAACAGMVAALYGMRLVPAFYWVFFLFGTTRVPPLALLGVWALNWALQEKLQPPATAPLVAPELGALVVGFCAGAVAAWLVRPKSALGTVAARAGAAAVEARRSDGASPALAEQAREAAARLDIKRATRLYRELVELEPTRTDYKAAYLNATLLGADQEALRDAALRLLWNKFRKPTDELRRTFLSLTQDKVLAALPVDEHLRLARRLVKFREDAAALRVIDALLRDENMRKTFGRQLADCLLGIFTAYSRHGLQRQAEQISTRLSTYFPTGSAIGGEAPANRPPPTIVTMFRNTAPGYDTVQPKPAEARAAPPTLPDSSGR